MMDRHYQIDRWIPDGSKILDLGCGDGSFLKDLSEKKEITGFGVENDFEKIVIPSYPEIGTLKSKLLELGASFASLSGSGSTVYGIFDDEALALKAKSYFYSSHKTILANPI